MLLAERHESERLRQIIKELQRHRFGRKAESLPEEQMLLGLEDVHQVAACTEASQDETAPEGRAERARKRRNNRGALPAHLIARQSGWEAHDNQDGESVSRHHDDCRDDCRAQEFCWL